MEKLTPREEELMRCFWTRGPLFVRELVALWPEPKPHFNTLSTMVRGLEAKGYVGHKAYGGTYQYYPLVSEEEFSRKTLKGVVSKYFDKVLIYISTLENHRKGWSREIPEPVFSIYLTILFPLLSKQKPKTYLYRLLLLPCC